MLLEEMDREAAHREAATSEAVERELPEAEAWEVGVTAGDWPAPLGEEEIAAIERDDAEPEAEAEADGGSGRGRGAARGDGRAGPRGGAGRPGDRGLSEPSPAVGRVARGMAREAWGGVADEAALARMVGHGWRAFVELVGGVRDGGHAGDGARGGA